MKAVIQTGTDTASLSFFDPTSVDKLLTNSPRSEIAQTIQMLSSQKKLVETVTGADGAYLFHFYVDEEPSETIMKRAKDPVVVDLFPVPSGRICVCGTEFVLRRDELQGKYRHMGNVFDVPAGMYAATMYRTEWPDSVIERVVRRSVGEKDRRLEQGLGSFSSICFLGGIISLLLSFTTNWKLTLPLGAALLGTAVAIWKSGPFKRMELARRQVEKDFPSLVVVMRKTRDVVNAC